MVGIEAPLVFFGNATDETLKNDIIAALLPILKIGEGKFRCFGDGELHWASKVSSRNQEVYIVQPTNAPAENFMELLIMIDALYRASSREITLVIPYLGYARQDHKMQREPITAKVVAECLTIKKVVKRVVLFGAHSPSLPGFFDCVVDHLDSTLLMGQYLEQYMKQYGLQSSDIIIIAPDPGAGGKGKALSKIIKCFSTVASKDRNYEDVDTIDGIDISAKNVNGRIAFLYDDIGSSLHTLDEAAKAAKQCGAKKVFAGVTHGVLIDGAIKRLNESPIELLITTNSIKRPLELKSQTDKLVVLSAGSLLGDTINRIYQGESVSELFDTRLPLQIY